MTVAARGINATVVEKDIGTINGVIQVIDRVLGVPYQTIYQRISTDPNMRLDLYVHNLEKYLPRRSCN
jgi:hypothetical protein